MAGTLLLAATGRGVCAVYAGSGARALVRRLRREYPGARIRKDARGLARWIRALRQSLWRASPDVPLDVRATRFQRRVWRVLRQIPPGQTLTYAQVARKCGMPRAARAVARACATNPVAVLVPCHRVVRSDGSLGGYRWGRGRKRALLQYEARRAGAATGRRA